MHTITISLSALMLAQVLKIFTIRPMSIAHIMKSGGMPSSHSAAVTSLATTIGFKYGFASDLFAIVTVFALIIMYDATGVRRAVGEQAKILNRIVDEISTGQDPEMIFKELKEFIGHTPVEVFGGAFLGIAISLVCNS
ncbi:MAG: divergent PAP2 family protein [Halanaerobiales bacterium]|nr:divergent PAP2 family protein [Halanaerobiales bacterium]